MPAANRRDGCRRDVAVDDGHRPLAVDVDVVARGVQVPAAHAGRTAPDLREVQPLRAGEPLHVRGRRADVERVDDGAAHLLQLVVDGLSVDAVGGHELRRDPARPHRLQHVRVVVRGEVHGHLPVDADRVVEALVALDELLDGDLGAVVDAAAGDRLLQLVGRVDPLGAGRAGAGRRLERRAGTRPRRRTAGRRRPSGPAVDAAQRMPAWRSTSFIAGLSRHRKAVRTDVPGIPHASRTRAAAITWASTVASSRSISRCCCSPLTTSYSRPSSTTDGTCS